MKSSDKFGMGGMRTPLPSSGYALFHVSMNKIKKPILLILGAVSGVITDQGARRPIIGLAFDVESNMGRYLLTT